MNKIILGFITFVSFFSFSIGIEANIRIGHDFFRYASYTEKANNKSSHKEKYNYSKNLVLGVELLPLTFKEERIKLGVGVEYVLGVNYYLDEIVGSPGLLGPLYATTKFTYYRPKNLDLNLYTFARLGYVFNRKHYRYDGSGGVYYGLGLGLDYKYFLVEILYDGRYNNKIPSDILNSKNNKNNNVNFEHFFEHKVGIRVGVQLGTQHFKKSQISKISNCTKCEPKIIEKIVEVPQVVETGK